MLPQCSHITKKRGVYYYRRRIPQSPNCEVVLSLRTRVFRVAECLADGLDQEFKSLIQGVTTDDNTDLAAILRIYLKKRLDLDMWRRAETPQAPMFGSPVPGKSHASVIALAVTTATCATLSKNSCGAALSSAPSSMA